MKLRIGGLLAERKMTQTALAEAVGVDKSHISNLISGRKGASLDILERIAAALDVPLVELFADSRSTLEADLIARFRRLSPEQQRAWLRFLDTMVQKTGEETSRGNDRQRF